MRRRRFVPSSERLESHILCDAAPAIAVGPLPEAGVAPFGGDTETNPDPGIDVIIPISDPIDPTDPSTATVDMTAAVEVDATDAY